MAGGGAIGEQRRRENRAENFKAFDFWNQHAEAFAGMRHVFAPEPQDHAGHRRITNFGKSFKACKISPHPSFRLRRTSARRVGHPLPAWAGRGSVIARRSFLPLPAKRGEGRGEGGVHLNWKLILAITPFSCIFGVLFSPNG